MPDRKTGTSARRRVSSSQADGSAAVRAETQGAIAELKLRIHTDLIDRLDLAAVGEIGLGGIRDEIRSIIGELLDEYGVPLSRADRNRLTAEVTSEVLGFGPLDELIRDPTVSDILVNSSSQVYVERKGKLELAEVSFRDDEHLIQIIDRIVSQVGRRIDASSPMVDARLPDGSRVNAVIPPVALDGPSLSIRRFSEDPFKVDDLVAFGSFTPDMARFMEAVVHARMNIIVSGGTGSGKTTLLNCLSGFIPEDERVVTIEDAAELQLQQPHVVRLETRPPNLENRGEVTSRDLVRNCLRMRPDRIVVGEVRSGEALDMLQAMNTGHDGSITTLHANTPRDCLIRLEMMILMAGIELPVRAMRQQISSAVNIVIQQNRLRDGTRKVMKITEIVGMEGDIITSQDLFEYVITGVGEDGKVEGHFQCSGIRPKCAELLEATGHHFDSDFFAFRQLPCNPS
ncbi:MAG: CpaF family protein [Candidatus Binatia bacterium]